MVHVCDECICMYTSHSLCITCYTCTCVVDVHVVYLYTHSVCVCVSTFCVLVKLQFSELLQVKRLVVQMVEEQTIQSVTHCKYTEMDWLVQAVECVCVRACVCVCVGTPVL